jgi:ABC-type nickel/cobalt efflux system permease component RcnA
MIYLLPITLAILSFVLLLAISVWKEWSVRRQSKAIYGIEGSTKVPDASALGKILGDARVMGGFSQSDQHQLRHLHSHAQLSSHKDETDKVQMRMALGVTVVIGTAALFVILSKLYDPDSLKWAYGALGTIIGYWLKK